MVPVRFGASRFMRSCVRECWNHWQAAGPLLMLLVTLLQCAGAILSPQQYVSDGDRDRDGDGDVCVWQVSRTRI